MEDPMQEGLDDERIAAAARRIIRQYRLNEGGAVETPAPEAKPLRTPDLPGMRQALDDMGQAIERIQRLMEHREAVFLASLERVERNLDKAKGRIDVLADEISQLASRPTIDVDRIVDDQKAAVKGILKEFEDMFALGRAMLDEAAQMRAVSLETVDEGVGRR
jgi:hypothetical protein